LSTELIEYVAGVSLPEPDGAWTPGPVAAGEKLNMLFGDSIGVSDGL
jgi:hypothetical protein